MPQTVNVLINNFLLFVLVMVRIGSLAMVAPLFSSQSIPPRVKAAFAAAVSLVVFPVVRPESAVVPTDVVGLTLAVFGEMFIGLTLGFAAALLFVGIEIGGALIARHMGTALASVFNPTFASTAPTLSQFYSLFALVVFIGMNGHHALLKILIGTFEDMPLMESSLKGLVAMRLVWMLGNAYVLAFKVAAAIMVSLLLVTVSLGIIARTVPQMNVLIMGFPLKVCLGLVVTAFTLGAMGAFFGRTFERMLMHLQGLLTVG
jgi:flagellar biosynthetic protein FliR